MRTNAAFAPDRWRRVEELFSGALDLPAAERLAWIRAECGDDSDLLHEVEGLLAQDSSASGIGPLIERVAESLPVTDQQPGLECGPWRLIRELGHGGMGTVWLATRSGPDFTQSGALKLLRSNIAGRLLVERFTQERRILAGLKHPNIAGFIDGGATRDSTPYFVMEYVEGQPLTDFADERKLAIPARLELFLKICDAVRYAHQHMVIHRDIKPGNILVTFDGVPKLLDFGIAKLLDPGPDAAPLAETSATMRLFTPDYASPEQVRGEPVSAATDVYQLGGVLYELVTAHKPHRLSHNDPIEMAKSICDTAITSPARYNRQIDRDLEIIILTAMAKESARRYQSAEEFSQDIRRYLDGHPISARPDSVAYRAGKFARRNWLPLLAASLGLSALIAGIVMSQLSARRAEHRFQQVRKLANHFVFDFDREIRQIPGTTRARALLVTTATEYLDSLAKEAAGDGGLQLELAMAYQNVGDVQGMTGLPNLGRPADALVSYRKSLAILRRLHDVDPRTVDYGRALALCLERLSFLQIFNGDKEGARRGLHEALALMHSSIRNRKLEYPDCRLLANGYVYLSELEKDESNTVAAVDDARAGVEWMRRYAQASPTLRARSDVARAIGQLGAMECVRGDHASALTHFHEEITLRESLAKDAPNHTENLREMATTLLNMADLYGAPGRPNLHQPEVALEHCRRAVGISQKLADVDRQNASAVHDLANAKGRLADILSQKDPVAALTISREALALVPPHPPGATPGITEESRTLRSRLQIGISRSMLAAGDAPGARRSATDALSDAPPGSRTLSHAYIALGNAVLALGDPDAARRHFSTAATLLEKYRQNAATDLEIATDLALAWEALEAFPDQKSRYRALRLALWQEWNRTLPGAYTRTEEERAAK